MMRSFLTAFAFGALVLIPNLSADAAALASDNAGNYGSTYVGFNNGTGFGVFTSSSQSNTGFFVGDSTGNGTGGSGGINTAGTTKSFGLFANNGNAATVNRSFAADVNGSSILAAGQTFSLTLDNGNIDTGSSVGFNLLSTSGATRFSFGFTGGASHYTFYNGTTTTDTGVNFTANGLAISFAQNADTGFTVTFTPSGGTATSFTSALTNADIAQFQIFNTNAGTGGASDLFFNSLSITGAVSAVPEPTTIFAGALVGMTGLIGLVRRLRRQLPR